jgi:hypothetical protein
MKHQSGQSENEINHKKTMNQCVKPSTLHCYIHSPSLTVTYKLYTSVFNLQTTCLYFWLTRTQWDTDHSSSQPVKQYKWEHRNRCLQCNTYFRIYRNCTEWCRFGCVLRGTVDTDLAPVCRLEWKPKIMSINEHCNTKRFTRNVIYIVTNSPLYSVIETS